MGYSLPPLPGFFPNAAVLTGYYSPTSFQLYTIGFEEQFYLVWPLLIRKFPLKSLFFPAFFAPLFLSLAHDYLHAHGLPAGGGFNAVIRGALTYIDYSGIPAFAAGAAAAYCYRTGEEQLRWLEKRNWGYVLVALLVLSMWLGTPQAPGYVNWLAILFALIILHFAGRSNAKSGDGGVLAAGGRISYGIYVYHPAVLLLVAAIFKKLPVIGKPVINYLLFVFYP